MNFKYTIDITADPEEVFTALTNPFQIELWSGYPAEMKAEEGFVFSLWEGDICGSESGGKAQSFACSGMVFRGDGSTFYCDH